MDILVRKTDEVIVANGTIIVKTAQDKYYIVETATHIQFIDRYDLFSGVTLPGDFVVDKYKYNTTDGFYLNEDYQEPIYLEQYVRANRDRIIVNEDLLVTAQARVLAAEGEIDTLQGQMSTAITMIQDLQDRVTALENA